MAWSEVVELFRYWRTDPPVHELIKPIAQSLGVRFEERKEPEPPRVGDDPSGIGALIAQFPSGNVPAER